MRKHVLWSAIFICMLGFASGIHAATVRIDPAVQNSPVAGEMLTVSVKVENIIGLFGYQLELAFDNAALKFSAIEEGEFFKADGTSTFTFLALGGQFTTFQNITPDMLLKVNSAGVLSVASSRSGNAKNVDGTGNLLTIKFEVLESKASKLELRNVLMADSDAQPVPVDLGSGTVEAFAGIKGDVNNDSKIRSDDTILTLRIAAELRVPTNYEKWAADANNDGKIGSDDAIIILHKAAELTAPGIATRGQGDAETGRFITVALGEAHGFVVGESITVPVKTDNTYGLAGGDISIRYDRTVLRAVDVSSDSSILLVSNLNEPGMVRIAFAIADRLSSETVARIRFEILADDASPLTLSTVALYNPGAFPLHPKVINREFRSWAMPAEHSELLQNFPNPFNPETWIPYQLKDAGEITIQIYNMTGELVRELGLGYKSAGFYTSLGRAAHWDGKDKFGTPVASGVYFYSIRAGGFTAVRKLIVLK